MVLRSWSSLSRSVQCCSVSQTVGERQRLTSPATRSAPSVPVAVPERTSRINRTTQESPPDRRYLRLSARPTGLNPHHHVRSCKSCHHGTSFRQSCKQNRWPSLRGPRGDQPPPQKPLLQDVGWEEPSTSWEPVGAAARRRQARENKVPIRRTGLHKRGIVVLQGQWIK